MRLRTFTMKGKIAALATLSAVLLTGCSGNSGKDDGGGTANDGDGAEKVTLTFAASTFGDPGRGPGLEAWLEEFNSSQDLISVEPAIVPFPTFGQTILTQMGAGEGPDLVRFDMPEFAAAADASLLEPLDEIVDVKQFDLFEGPDGFMFSGDSRAGVIFEASNYALYYNTDLVPEAPTTFDEFMAAAETNTGDGIFGMAFRHTAPEENGMWQDIFNYVLGFGGAFSDGEHLTINDPAVVKGLEAYQSVYDANVIPKGADAATFRAMFNEGKVAMEIDNGGFVAAVRGANADLPFSVAPIPFPERSQGAIFAPITVNAASKNTEAAGTFIEWMLQPENQKSLQQVLGSSSVATRTERTAAEIEASPFIETVDALTETSVPQVVLGYEARTADLRSIIIEEVLRALDGAVSMQEAMDTAQERATAAVS